MLLTTASDYYRALIDGRVPGVWPAMQRGGLWAASVPYGWIVRLRNRLYDAGWKRSQRAPVPVISVGNLTLGGTGKTPCVEYVAGFYCRLRRRVAILSRGYGCTGGPNDEALVLRENLPDVPHLQGADRVALAFQAVREEHSEVLVLDDGFQHRRLARDLDVVLVDATQPWGRDHLFPRGLLRESWAGLRRAGVVLLTRCDQVRDQERGRLREAIACHVPTLGLVETTHRPVDLVDSERNSAPLERLKGRPVAAFCGIGNPEAFRATLAGLGSAVQAFRVFPDHHPYSRTDLEALDCWARQQATDCLVVTTQKDLVKLRRRQLGGKETWALRIRLHVEVGQDALERKLLDVIKDVCSGPIHRA
jgi:tetraacyldisaccharide 4'-kinase